LIFDSNLIVFYSATIKIILEKLYRLTFLDSLAQLKGLLDSDLIHEINPKKHSIDFLNHSLEKIINFRLPLSFPLLKTNSLAEYMTCISERPLSLLIVLIQAGSASIGFFNDATLVHHKVIKKYMVRKKQGKAQISYLNEKGKSRAGSRIRLANTYDFFEEINQKLWDWNITPERILYSCPIKLWNLVFESKIDSFFSKSDERLLKIPRDVQIPNFDELKRISTFAGFGHFTIFNNDGIGLLIKEKK
jgi:hypothetical protein